MTGEHNAEEMKPVSPAIDGPGNALRPPPDGQSPKAPSQDKSEQKDAANEGTQESVGHDEEADEQKEETAVDARPKHEVDDKPYSVFTHNEKRIIVFCAGLSQFFSPISGQIYFPSLDAIAADLHVSSSLVNLTITSYLVSAFS